MRLFSIALAVAVATSPPASAERLTSRSLHIGKIEKVYLAPGLVTVIDFPEEITEASVGAPQVIKQSISQVHPTELIIQLTSTKPFSTNLIVRTTKRTYVFDLVPSQTRHQDVLKVRNGYGQLQDGNTKPRVIEKGELD